VSQNYQCFQVSKNRPSGRIVNLELENSACKFQNFYCRELVKLLVQRLERLKEPSLLFLAAHKSGALLGLNLVGEAEGFILLFCYRK
jgi:hypothetical protein